MDNIYIDTNILLDVFAGREPFYKDSFNFLRQSKDNYNFYVSVLSFHIVMYVMKPSMDEKQIIKKIFDKLNTISLTKDIADDALDIDIKDYEDILQFNSAVKHCRTIVTRDPKDFKKLAAMSRKKVEILSPKQWLKQNTK